jgi:hypothetical protein
MFKLFNIGKGRILLTLILLALSLNTVAFAEQDRVDEYFTFPDFDPETAHIMDWMQHPAPALLDRGTALMLLYEQFPQLLHLERPDVDFVTFDLPLRTLALYSYSWDDSVSITIDQDAYSGAIIQYIDFTALQSLDRPGLNQPLSAISAYNIARMRFHNLREESVRTSFFASVPHLTVSDNGLLIFNWAKQYFGIPFYDEFFLVAIHPFSGMPVIISEQRNYAFSGEAYVPHDFLKPDEALMLVKRFIDPVLVHISMGAQTPVELVWHSGIPFSSFLAHGHEFNELKPMEGLTPPYGRDLLLDYHTAKTRFSENLSLTLEWRAVYYEDPTYGELCFIEPIYVIHFTPINESKSSVLPALISETEFINRLKR